MLALAGALAAIPGVPRDHEVDVQLAMLTSFTAITVALIGFLGLYFQGRQHSRKLDKTYDHINNLEENEAVPDGEGEPPTLGGLVRDGFKRNDEAHALLFEVVKDHGSRLDAHRGELDGHEKRLGKLEE